jgi:hypothetical protein
LWVGIELPDGLRLSQLFSSLEAATLSRFNTLSAGEDMLEAIHSVHTLSSQLSGIGLIVIDDWAPPSGSIPTALLSSVSDFVRDAEQNSLPLLLISSANAAMRGVSKESQPDSDLNARGQSKLDAAGAVNWMLRRDGEGLSRRSLRNADEVLSFTLGDQGFTSTD